MIFSADWPILLDYHIVVFVLLPWHRVVTINSKKANDIETRFSHRTIAEISCSYQHHTVYLISRFNYNQCRPYQRSPDNSISFFLECFLEHDWSLAQFARPFISHNSNVPEDLTIPHCESEATSLRAQVLLSWQRPTQHLCLDYLYTPYYRSDIASDMLPT